MTKLTSHLNKPYSKERQISVKLMHIDALGGKCSVCGYSKNLAALDLHHKNPNQKDNVREPSRIFIDYDRFILLCSNCHKEIHNPSYALDLARKIPKPKFIRQPRRLYYRKNAIRVSVEDLEPIIKEFTTI
jgi:5-methylcytosine-specific restriction endonuclease McrA